MEQLLNHVRGFSFGTITYPNGGKFGPILRPYLALIYVQKGACALHTDGTYVGVHAGQIGVAAANERFEFDYRHGLNTSVIWCEGFLPNLPSKVFTDMNRPSEPIEGSRRLIDLLEIGLDIGYDSGRSINSMRDAVGQAVLRSYLYESNSQSQHHTLPNAVHKARQFIKENLHNEELSLEKIASYVGISQQHLINSFKFHLGTTPSRYLWRLRANLARQFLIHSQSSQTEIAYKCGYKSNAHFSRSIKSHFGMTPHALRKDMGFTLPSDTEETVEDIVY